MLYVANLLLGVAIIGGAFSALARRPFDKTLLPSIVLSSLMALMACSPYPAPETLGVGSIRLRPYLGCLVGLDSADLASSRPFNHSAPRDTGDDAWVGVDQGNRYPQGVVA